LGTSYAPDGARRRRGTEGRCAILPPDSGSRYPSALWCLVPVWKPGLGRLRPRRWCRSALLPQVGVDPGGKTAFTRPCPTPCPRVPLVHSGGWYATTQVHIVTPRPCCCRLPADAPPPCRRHRYRRHRVMGLCPPERRRSSLGPERAHGLAAPWPPLRRLHRCSARHRRLAAAVPGDDGRDGIDGRVLDPAV